MKDLEGQIRRYEIFEKHDGDLILLDTATGKTFERVPAKAGGYAWLPMTLPVEPMPQKPSMNLLLNGNDEILPSQRNQSK